MTISPFLLEQLHSEDAGTRWQAIQRIYQQSPDSLDTATIDILITLLSDPHVGVRTYVIKTLKQDVGRSLTPLLIAMQERRTTELYISAAAILARVYDERASLTLAELAQDGRKVVRVAAFQAIARRNDKAFLPHLIEGLNDVSKHVRYHAALGLSRLNLTTAPPELLRALYDHEPMVRGAAMLAVGKIGDRAALSPLVDALRVAIEHTQIRAALSAEVGKPMTEEDWRRFSWSHGQVDLPLVAVHALAGLGEPARATLQAMCQEENERLVFCATWALALLDSV
jgi:HEAT repeat protein